MNSKHITILHAEDDLDDSYFFKNALEELSLPMNYKSVYDGVQLMNTLKNETLKLPDIVFLDINMPCKNGIECLTEIKKDSRLSNIPIVIISTTNTRETINLVFKLGAHLFIKKPNDYKQLKQTLQHSIPIATENNYSNKPLNYIINA